MRFRWDERELTMRVTPYFRQLARRIYQDGKVYDLEENTHRSARSHAHFMAAVEETWSGLPEELKDRWTSGTEFRKWCLTYTEFRTVHEFQVSSQAEAIRLAKAMQQSHDYSRIEIDHGGKLVRVILPRSQAYSAMDNRTFQRSKNAVFDVMADKLGVTVDELSKNAGRAA